MDSRSGSRGGIRVSDADRDQAVAELSEALTGGRLTQEEFEERSALAFQARTGDDLGALFTDLPRRPVAPAAGLDSGPGFPASGDYRPRPGYHVPVVRVVIALVLVSALLGTVFGHHHGGFSVGWLIPVVILGSVLARMFRHR